MAELQAPVEDQLLQRIKEVDEDGRIDFIKREKLHTWTNSLEETLIHFIAKSGNIEMIKVLIEAGADVNAESSSGKTPIMLVVDYKPPNDLDIIKVLYFAKADIHTVYKCGKSAIQSVLEKIDSKYDDVHYFFLNIIHQEFKRNSELTAKYLVDFNYPLWQAVLLPDERVIENMILCGCPIDSCHPTEKYTALMKALRVMHLTVANVLFKYNASVDFGDDWDFLPTMWYGPVVDDRVQLPEFSKIVLNKPYLLKNVDKNDNIKFFKSDFERGDKKIIKKLLDLHTDILNFRDSQDQTPLHYLTLNLHSDITELLENQEIDANVKDCQDCTPLFIATKTSYTHINTYKFLLARNADVNVITQHDLEVPLFALCYNSSLKKESYFEIIELFLQYGLNIQYMIKTQETVFDIIKESEDFYKAEPLLAHLAILDELKKPILECIRNKINSHEEFKNIFDACKAELIEMKNNIINDRLNLHMIVVNEKPKVNEKRILNICRYSSNSLLKFKNLEEKFHSDNYYYDNIVKTRISSILIRLELLQKAGRIVSKILKWENKNFNVVISRIIDYLNNQDLQNLIRI